MTDWILYEDNHLVVVNKPAGLLSQSAEAGDDNALDRVKRYLKVKYDKPGNVYVGLVHRLDRNVSGCMVFARTSKAASRLAKAFQKRSVEKGYLAVVEGVPDAGPSGRRTLEHRLGPRAEGERGVMVRDDGKPARLHFQVIGDDGARALLAVSLDTGRKHQIRAQLREIGHAVLGDPLYGRADHQLGRPLLHAWRLAFEHPVKRTPIVFNAPVSRPMTRFCFGMGFDPEATWPFSAL